MTFVLLHAGPFSASITRLVDHSQGREFGLHPIIEPFDSLFRHRPQIDERVHAPQLALGRFMNPRYSPAFVIQTPPTCP